MFVNVFGTTVLERLVDMVLHCCCHAAALLLMWCFAAEVLLAYCPANSLPVQKLCLHVHGQDYGPFSHGTCLLIDMQRVRVCVSLPDFASCLIHGVRICIGNG